MPTLGSLIYVTGDATTNVDSKYGPYNSVQDAIDSLGPNGDDMLCSGLTFGVTSGSAVNEY